MAKIRYAVVGLGSIAQGSVLPAFEHAENSELTALVSDDPEKLQVLGERYRIDLKCSYADYDRCLESGQVDAVYIALPNHLHAGYAIRAAHRGIHVLCEKPMAPSEQECEAMMAAAADQNVKLMIAYRLHFEQGNLEAIRIAQSGELGDLRMFNSVFSQQVVEGNIRLADVPGAGPVFDMGVYCINAARYIFRDEPTEVLAMTANNGESRFRNTEEIVAALLRFPGERIATFTVSFGATPTDSYVVVGTKGMLRLNPGYEYAGPICHELTVDGKRDDRLFAQRDQFAAELVYFSNCILRNEEPEPSGEEGLLDVRIVNAIHRSAKSGAVVQLPQYHRTRRPGLDQEIARPAVEQPELVHAEMPSGEK